jgi:integrase
MAMGFVFKKPGRHIWLVRFYHDGKPVELSSGTKSKRAANKFLAAQETAAAQGLLVRGRKLRFEEAAQDLLRDYRVNNKVSIDCAERRLRLHLTPFFKGRTLASITTSDIRTFTAARLDAKPPASNAEVNRELAVLKRMYSLALQAGRLHRKPHIPMLTEDNTRKGFFDDEQFAAVLKRLPDYLAAPCRFAFVTGWRLQSEVLTLEWRSVDFQAGTVTLDPGSTKNKEGRVFPFSAHPELVDVLGAQKQLHDKLAAKGTLCPLVFHRKGQSMIDASGWILATVRKVWRRTCKKAGVPGRIPHDFRRTAVRNLVRAGVSERVAMQLTGHKTRSVFERYNVVTGSDLQDAVLKLAGRPYQSTQKGRATKAATILRGAAPWGAGQGPLQALLKGRKGGPK